MQGFKQNPVEKHLCRRAYGVPRRGLLCHSGYPAPHVEEGYESMEQSQKQRLTSRENVEAIQDSHGLATHEMWADLEAAVQARGRRTANDGVQR